MRFPKLCILIPLILLGMFMPTLSADSFTGEARYAASDLTITERGGFDVFEMIHSDQISLPGSPALPCRQINVALPDGAVVEGVSVVDADFIELEGTFNVRPSARVRRISNPAGDDPFVKNASIYDTNAAFPGRWVEGLSEWELTGQQFATLRLFPVQYNPVTGKVFLATKIDYEVNYTVDPQHARQTYNFSDKVHARNLKKLQNLAVNPQAVTLPAWTGMGSRALDPGNYEHVVITTSTYESDFFSLSEHYNKCGVPSKIVNTTWIYSNYSGTTNKAEIRNFIKDAHATWGTIYFLLGGDSSKIPYDTYYSSGDNIPNDTYYADYDDDWRCEVYVGRAPVDTSTEISNFIDKTLDYMVSPPSGFGEEVFQMGFDLDSSTDGEDLMIDIYNSWCPSWADYDREYDSESGGHESDVKGYINSGHSLTNHCDHCNYNVVGVGTHNHGTSLSNSECDAFYNSTRYGLFYTLGCWPGAFDYSDCWGEHFVKDTNGGGFAFVGNTRYGWYSPGNPGLYSGRYTKKFFKSVWDYGYYVAGETLGESKNDYYPGDSTYKYIFRELTLIGDPAVPIWTNVPGTFSATHSTSINPGSQSYSVTVKQGTSNYSGALVCLYKGSQVYATGTTNYLGQVSLTINPTDGGTMYVTVTDQNMKPYMGQCTVSGGSAPDLEIDLSLDKTTYSRGNTIIYTMDVINNTAQSQPTKFWTNVTVPNGNTYPSTGYLDYPMSITLTPYQTQTWPYSRRVPVKAPIGNYTFHAFVGPDPGIVDSDDVPFSVTW